ncbi:sporulation protein [Saccharothrix violaceirubra]|uniref:Sporulation-control protein n=1 Tax=Saccharothrix violaceirubra TaxID=413306 RepID=A0A7W7T0C5_9PSEU|nr:sporulation protein [Saccharothrix violaceirubra]MBB4964267.1 sporulation-control protein [Saccharothrix violaceirubra]
MFKRMLSAFGVGGPSVDTVLDTPHAVPGQAVSGQVRIQGGSAEARIDRIVLSLVTRVEVEHGDHEYGGNAEFLSVVVAEHVVVAPGQALAVPFRLPLPWETPITAIGGQPLPGVGVGVRTELVIAGAPDKGDLDLLLVGPLPAQDSVLDAFGRLGFQFRKTDVEVGRIHGVHQELGFYQELEFSPPGHHAGRVDEVELTFVTSPHELVVVLEADKRGGAFSSGGDAFGRFHVSHQDAPRTDWATLIDQWLTQVSQRASAFGGHPGQHGHHGYDHGHHGHHGSGVGGVVAGAAAGVVGGMIIGEVLDDAFEDGGEAFGFDEE